MGSSDTDCSLVLGVVSEQATSSCSETAAETRALWLKEAMPPLQTGPAAVMTQCS